MTKIVRLTSADVRRLPWKNGRGETAQIAMWPEHADFARGDFDWRLSRAAVTESGPFSAFPGCDRVLVIVDGTGIDLQHGEAAPRAHVEPWQSYAFSGDWPTTATLSTGPVQDFNVLVRHDRASASVEAISCLTGTQSLVVAGDHVLVHVIDGHLEVTVDGAGAAIELEPFATLWLRDLERSRAMTLVSGAATARLLITRIVGSR